MEVKELWDRLSTPGDVAAALLGYAAGFVCDNYFFVGGLPPGTVAAVSSVGCLGVKKAFDSIFRRPVSTTEVPESSQLQARADVLRRYLGRLIDRSDSPKTHPLLPVSDEFDAQMSFWANGVISDVQFFSHLEAVASICQEYAEKEFIRIKGATDF